MTRWISRGRLMITAITVAMAFGAQAAERPNVCTGDPVVTKLGKSAAKEVADWLKDPGGADKPAPHSFKVPALSNTRMLCKLNAEGLRCFEVLDSVRCPDSVEVETPAGSTEVPVNCTGPVNGECDCDFVQG